MFRQKLFSGYRLLPFVVIITLMVITTLRLMPGLTVNDPVIRITVTHKGMNLPDGFFLYQQLTESGISVKSITPDQDSMVIHLANEEQQLAAHLLLSHILSDAYTTV